MTIPVLYADEWKYFYHDVDGVFTEYYENEITGEIMCVEEFEKGLIV